MIKGVHAMFYASHAEELRAFIRDKLGFPVTDAGYGLTTLMKMPGGVVVELYQPHYAKKSER